MTVEQTDRESVAKRLLRSSVDHSHEPAIDIGWDAEPVDGLYGGLAGSGARSTARPCGTGSPGSSG